MILFVGLSCAKLLLHWSGIHYRMAFEWFGNVIAWVFYDPHRKLFLICIIDPDMEILLV